MNQMIALITLLVRDYDAAIDYYVNTLGFELLEDVQLSASKRWVRVRPRGMSGTALLLAKAADETQALAIGAQAGGRVFLFLETDDFDRDYANYLQRGVLFSEEPRLEAYGKVAVFHDLYGNPWDLIEHKKRAAK